MLRRDRHRLTEAEVVAFERAGSARAALALVGDENGRLAGTPQQVDEGAIGRHHPGAGIDDEEHRVGRRDRSLGLGAHAAGQAFARGVLEAGGVDDGEGEIAEAGGRLAAITGYAWRVVDQRKAATGEPVEQRRFADVGAADDGDGEAHGGAPPAPRRRPRNERRWRGRQRAGARVTCRD